MEGVLPVPVEVAQVRRLGSQLDLAFVDGLEVFSLEPVSQVNIS